jgi:maleamate amidohydrolase
MDLDRIALPFGKRPALILIDLMLGFTDEACPLGSASDDVIAANLKLLNLMRARQLPIFFTRVVYDNDTQATTFRARLPALNYLMRGQRWTEIDPRLERKDDETLIDKLHPSAFFQTHLDKRLRAEGADCVIITGLTTSGCVRASVVDGLQNGWPVFVPKEACGDRNQQAHEANLFDIHAKYGEVMSLSDMLATLEALS